MSEIRFYHLQRSNLEAALPKMLEKIVERKQRALVLAGSEERVEALAAHLWSYDDRSFLPHGTVRDGAPESQPIWLSERDENPNGADVLFLTDGATSAHIGDYPLCVELFDGQDEAAVVAARARWDDYRKAGHSLIYYQQDEAGRWQEKARA